MDWLLQQNIVADREEGLQYGHALMMGGVLAHVQEEHYFHMTLGTKYLENTDIQFVLRSVIHNITRKMLEH